MNADVRRWSRLPATSSVRVERAGPCVVETLLEALPYIREFHGRTVVIKYGGAAMPDEALRDGFATDVVLLKYVGLNPVIVHGGGPDITRYMERLGMEVRFVEGVRVSDPETVEVAKMVLLGKVNSDIVMRLNRHGQPAVGLSGEDGALFEIRPHARADEVGFVGEIERVDVDVLNHIAEDYIPVIASAGADRDGNSYNVNADTAAGKVAAALRAYKAIFLTDVAGWLADPDDEASLHSRATRRRGRGGARLGRGRHAAEARRLRRGDPAAASARRTSSTAAARTACCSSCSPTRASARWSPRERRRAAGARGALRDDTYARAPVEFVRGVGARLWDAEGNEYLDFFAGLSVHNAGHCHPRIVAAISEQAARLAGSSNLFYSEPAMRLCERLAESSLGGRVFLCNSGAEASECAIKLVRKRAHAARDRARPRSSSSTAPSTAARSGRWRRRRGSPARTSSGRCRAGFVAVPRDDPDALRAAVGERTAAVMIEPIQGEAGIFPIADEVLVAAREACDEAGAALVFDEVQCGMGRTGTLWAYEQLPRAPGRDHGGEGARRRPARSAPCVTAPELGEVLGARRPRLDLRRRADRRRARRSRRSR